MELKRRTRIAGLFPNEASLLRLASALFAEISDEWETGKACLNMGCQIWPSVSCSKILQKKNSRRPRAIVLSG